MGWVGKRLRSGHRAEASLFRNASFYESFKAYYNVPFFKHDDNEEVCGSRKETEAVIAAGSSCIRSLRASVTIHKIV